MKSFLGLVLMLSLPSVMWSQTNTQDKPPAALSCTWLVSQEDCKSSTWAFMWVRDNKVFNDVEVLIADEASFREEKSRVAFTQAHTAPETGLNGPVALLIGEDQDNVLVFFVKGPVPHITRVVVSVAAFYKVSQDAKGNLSKATHFDSNSAYIVAAKINGYVSGWFMGVAATIK